MTMVYPGDEQANLRALISSFGSKSGHVKRKWVLCRFKHAMFGPQTFEFWEGLGKCFLEVSGLKIPRVLRGLGYHGTYRWCIDGRRRNCSGKPSSTQCSSQGNSAVHPWCIMGWKQWASLVYWKIVTWYSDRFIRVSKTALLVVFQRVSA